MTLDLHAWWNAAQLADLLRGIVGIVDAAEFRVMLSVLALLGLLAVTTSAVVRNRPFEIASWFIAVVLLFSIAFVPRVSVTVSDVRAQSAQTVAGVPMGLALPAALSSKIGRTLAVMLETALADVEAARFTSFGAVFPERAVAAVAKAGPVSPAVRGLLEGFIDRCVAPEVTQSDARMAELMTSASLVATVTAQGWTNPARFLMHEGAPLRCPDAATALLAMLRDVEVPAQERLLMTRLSSDGTEVAEAALRRAVPEAATRMLGLSQTLAESLGHAVLLAEIPKGLEREAARLELPLAGAVAVAKAQGSLASEISFRTMGELAAAFLPKLRNLLEFVLIAAFPIVILMLVAAGSAGTSVARMYLTLFLWLALWAPVATVINALLVAADATPMGRLAAQYGGLTLEAADLIRDAGATSQAMAGYMMMLVPLVSYLIAKASDMGAASLAGSMMSPAAGAAQSQSAALSAGNVSAGNASLGNATLNNTAANKSDASTAFTAGAVTRTSSAWGTVTRDASTGAVSALSVAASDLGVSAASTLSRGETNAVASTESSGFTSSEATSSAASAATASGTGFSAGTVTTVQDSSSRSTGTSDAVVQGVASSTGASSRTSTGFTSGSSFREDFGLSTETGARVGAGATEGALVGMEGGNLASGVLNAGTLGTFPGAGAGTARVMPGVPDGSIRNAGPAPVLRGGATVSGDFSAGGRLRTTTSAANADDSWRGSSGETGSAWESRSGEETRSTRGLEDRRTASVMTSGTESRTSSSSDERRHTATSAATLASGATHARTAGRTAERSTGTGARLDSWLAARAIETYGSPEAALEALANPAERAAFAGEAMSEAADGRFLPADGRGVRTPSGAAVLQGADVVRARTVLDRGAVRRAGLPEAERTRREAAEQLEAARSAPTAADAGAVRTGTPAAALERIETERGAIVVADALWRERSVTAGGVLSTALFAGVAYDSPEALHEELLRAAGRHPSVAAELRDAARRGTPSPRNIEAIEKPSTDGTPFGGTRGGRP